MRQALSMIARYLLVMSVAAAGLAVLDRVPAWLTGATHGARVYPTIAAAEEALGASLWLPAYYPDVLAWPPERVEATAEPRVAAIRIADRQRRAERLVICQSIGAVAPAAGFPELLPPAEEVSAAEVKVDGHPARLARLMTPGGRIVHDLSWAQDGRRVTMRYEGTVVDLLRMAASMGRGER